MDIATPAFREEDPSLLESLGGCSVVVGALLEGTTRSNNIRPIRLSSMSDSFTLGVRQLGSSGRTNSLVISVFVACYELIGGCSVERCSPPIRGTLACVRSSLSTSLDLSALTTVRGVSTDCLSGVFGGRASGAIARCMGNGHVSCTTRLLTAAGRRVRSVTRVYNVVSIRCFSGLFGGMGNVAPGRCHGTERGFARSWVLRMVGV